MKEPVRFQFPKLGLKLLALLLGIMAWYLIQDAIRLEGKADRKLLRTPVATNTVLRLENLPVTVLSRPGAWEWRLDQPAGVTVLLEGTDAELGRVERSTVRVFVDGSIINQPGEFISMPLRVYVPNDVRLKTMTDPERVRVSVKPAAKGGP